MRKILYNQCFFNDKNINQPLFQIYSIVLRIDGYEEDVKEVIKFSNKYHSVNRIYPTPEIIKEKYKEFKFIEEKFSTESEFLTYIQNKFIEFRDNYRQELGLQYIRYDISYKERLEILDKLNRIEIELMPEEESNIVEIDNYDLESHYKNRKIKGSGIPSNIPEIDEITGGFSDGKILVIAGKPGDGKTTQAINMIYLGLLLENNNTLFMTLELPKDEVFMKLVIRHSYGSDVNISSLKMLKGILNDEEEKLFFELKKDFLGKKKSKLILYDVDDVVMSNIFQFKNQLLLLIDKYDLKTIYIDFIQLFKEFKIPGYDELEFLNAVVITIRHISISKNVRFIILSQINRVGQIKGEKSKSLGKYSLNNLAEINSLERYAYYVLTFYMDDTLKINNQLLVQLLKHKDGETIAEPFKTFIKHNYFVIGNVESNLNIHKFYSDMLCNTKKDSENNFSDNEYVNLFDNK